MKERNGGNEKEREREKGKKANIKKEVPLLFSNRSVAFGKEIEQYADDLRRPGIFKGQPIHAKTNGG